jgi:hypothetical protein
MGGIASTEEPGVGDGGFCDRLHPGSTEHGPSPATFFSKRTQTAFCITGWAILKINLAPNKRDMGLKSVSRYECTRTPIT